eukprot:CAMPEP_0119089816 /NCGR_PEP_ID=MMETSP1178-20130426/150357_1 /TAXON_ID=33656 /ORGANISM="unid sp, Strain CCMP2000" /LENGTH=227 /DNA_ID=CAMNT_0007073197 /DNA_START=116 /DNA_END=799 /DNA_ORIENTATION=+
MGMAKLDDTRCGCCGMDVCSVVPEPMAVWRNWNGRGQNMGLDRLGNKYTLRDDPNGDVGGPGRELSPKEVHLHLHDMRMSNIAIAERDGAPDLTNEHYDATTLENLPRMRLSDGERGEPTVERALDGTLALWPKKGDKVKIALDIVTFWEQAPEPPPFLDRASQARGIERYWAYVLDAPDDDDDDDALVVLPDPELKFLPPPIASKPFIVSETNVYAVIPWQIPDDD